jgi:hypothetical protein
VADAPFFVLPITSRAIIGAGDAKFFVPQGLSQLIYCHPRPADMNYAMAVGAKQGQLFDLRPLAGQQLRNRSRVMALDETSASFAVASGEAEPASLAIE